MLIPWSAVFSMQHGVYAKSGDYPVHYLYICCPSEVAPTQGELVRQDRSESMSGHCLLLFSYSHCLSFSDAQKSILLVVLYLRQ